MKKSTRKLPNISKREIDANLPKTKAILLRLSVADKASIEATAKSLHLTSTEYLVKCHQLVAAKVSG